MTVLKKQGSLKVSVALKVSVEAVLAVALGRSKKIAAESRLSRVLG